MTERELQYRVDESRRFSRGEASQFFSRPPAYYESQTMRSRAETTLPRPAWDVVSARVVERLSDIRRPGPPLLLDVAGGTGYFCYLVVDRAPQCRCVVIDSSIGMLEVGGRHLNELSPSGHLEYVAAKAESLPFRSRVASAVTLFNSIHLFADVPRVLQEAYRCLCADGTCWILTFSRHDLASTVYHRHFPGYFDVDARRYLPLEGVVGALEASGFDSVLLHDVPYSVRYGTVEALLDLVRQRPFSTFAYYSPSEFENGLEVFEERLRAEFGSRPVINESKMTLVEARATRRRK